MPEKEKPTEPAPEIKYKGRELIRSTDGTAKDILRVVLSPNKEYSVEDVKRLIDKFLKKEVIR